MRAPGPRLPRRGTIVPGSLSQLQTETFLHPPPPEPGLRVTFGTISAKKSAPDRRFPRLDGNETPLIFEKAIIFLLNRKLSS